MGFRPYYLNFVMIKRDNSLWKFLLFCQNCMEPKCACVTINITKCWIWVNLKQWLEKGFQKLHTCRQQRSLTSKNLCVVNLLSLFIWCNLWTKVLKELESWNYALQVDIHVHQWFFAFPCQSSKKNNILGHKGTS